MTSDERRIIEWLATGRTGVSSESIAFRALGTQRAHESHPWDVDDFRRCVRLLEFAPNAIEGLRALADTSRQWARLADKWDEIAECMNAELGINRHSGPGKAPVAYKMIREAIEEG